MCDKIIPWTEFTNLTLYIFCELLSSYLLHGAHRKYKGVKFIVISVK